MATLPPLVIRLAAEEQDFALEIQSERGGPDANEVETTRQGLAGIRETVTALAEVEGLLAHRDAIESRFTVSESD